MTGRERLLTALDNRKPDRLPCQVHDWMAYYLQRYLDGRDAWSAYAYFGMDPVIYVGPRYEYDERDLARWVQDTRVLGTDRAGVTRWIRTTTTPEGTLVERGAYDAITPWQTENMIKTHRDFELWERYAPAPVRVDWTPVTDALTRLGDRGIVRAGFYDFGQGSPWQSFANYLYDAQAAILLAYDDPEWLHHCLGVLLARKLRAIELCDEIPLDLVECGGGAGSSTLISPDFHRAFCLPYDRRQIRALHEHGTRVVYHLCGGLMPLLETVVENGADGLETMTPPDMGGDCDLAEATRRVGDRLFFIGGFDQNRGFERGTPQDVREMVYALHRACPDGGYICCPSDHFFHGPRENIAAFVAACEECAY